MSRIPSRAAVLAALASSAACFAPAFDEGAIACGPAGCPPGLVCHDDGLCYTSPPSDDPPSLEGADAGVADCVDIVEDSLDIDRGLLAPAPGFAVDSWTYRGNAYRQERLADNAEDAALLLEHADLADVAIEARVASTQIADFGPDDLRQLFLLARATATSGDGDGDDEDRDARFSAYACGIEVVEGYTPEQKTSVVGLTGRPGALTTVVKQRSDRAAVQEGEPLDIRMELRGSTMTCTVTIDGQTTTTAMSVGVPAVAGAIGFYTRETKALFRDLSVCHYR